MERNKQTTIMGYTGFGGLGVGKNGQENGCYYNGLYGDYPKGPFLHS